MEGWVKLYRQLEDWQWINKPEMVSLFIYCLIRANHSDCTWQNIEIKRGTFITSPERLSSKLGITYQSVRTCLTRLEKTGEINKQTTNKYTIITINNYDSYQSDQQTKEYKTNKQLTNNQQTTNKQLTTDKNEKNNKNDNNEKEYINEAYILNDYCQNFFDPKYINEKSLETFDKLIRIDKYSPPQIQEAISKACNDNFWAKNFLSPVKLRDKNKDKVQYIDVFLKITQNKTKHDEAGEYVANRLRKAIEDSEAVRQF